MEKKSTKIAYFVALGIFIVLLVVLGISYKDAPILILDDSVSAVDTRTEKIILDNLKKSRAGKTTLLIAHRISTVEGLDKIVFLEDGRVEAVGPHDQLYASCPEYSFFFQNRCHCQNHSASSAARFLKMQFLF